MQDGKDHAAELFAEAERHLMKDDRPSVFFESDDCPLRNSTVFTPIFALMSVKQSPKHHPEGNAFIHTMMVVDEAAARRSEAGDPRAFMCAALLHDLGKASTTRLRRGRITSYDHDKAGEKLAVALIRACGQSEEFARKTAALVRYHMHMLYVLGNMPFADVKGMKKSVDIKDLALLVLCDRMGRTSADREGELDNIGRFLQVVGG